MKNTLLVILALVAANCSASLFDEEPIKALSALAKYYYDNVEQVVPSSNKETRSRYVVRLIKGKYVIEWKVEGTPAPVREELEATAEAAHVWFLDKLEGRKDKKVMSSKLFKALVAAINDQLENGKKIKVKDIQDKYEQE